MSVFGTPVETTDHADRALVAAVDIVDPRLAAFNEWVVGRGIDRRFEIGVGVNSGVLMSGNIGSERRMESVAIGDTTNTAARVESLTKEFGVPLLITESVVESLRRPVPDLEFVTEVAPRGRAGMVRLWTQR